MPLDYSKWDNLELSDDSDIEVHPNVDKRSMIKWKREAIHRERAERKAKMDYLGKFVPTQQKALKKVQELIDMLQNNDDDEKGIRLVMDVLDKQQQEAAGMQLPSLPPQLEQPSQQQEQQQKPMDMAQVFAAMKAQIATGLSQTTPAEVKITLLERFKQTAQTIEKTVEDSSKELKKLQKEASKKLTSENMFTSEKTSKTILNKPKPIPSSTTKKTEKKKVVETLNPDVKMKDLSLENKMTDRKEEEEQEEEEEDIDMSPKAAQFSKIKGFEDSFKFLTNNPEIINEKSSDSILGQAFTAQLKGDEEYAKNCVIQSLTLQYCGQLGRDGVKLFFSKMSIPNTQGHKMFIDDVEKTYGRIRTRCVEIAAEQIEEGSGEGVETIQLQPMGDGSQLTIRVPEPEHEEAYQKFTSMPAEFQEAVKVGTLDALNKVLGALPVSQAEALVKICSDYGFLDVEGEVVDQTGRQQQPDV
ncbi:hypothetical protein BDF20DRAFT_983242 [Mycotypha africana]|uniref:uncharacterized protein n=1 Tax=Mycotypha africana TaxID=64632 RepID=UPI002301029B|nr:uncharacterized protein BDF20DRAFT_983242 [Mycotypha africana]KAI8967103.1 hypothetical protein BDF20DRAFT_983242 [Mycotypha africana]